MMMIKKHHVIMMHEQLIDATLGSNLLRDDGMLESALSAPFQSYAGQEAYTSVIEKAARLCYGLVKDHPFVDGNKRIGIHTALVFLEINGVKMVYTQDELVSIVMSLASGEIGYDEILNWMCKHAA